MREPSPEPQRKGFTCPVCGRFIVTTIEGLFTNARSGSPRRFCDHACRQAAYRRRRAGAAEETPLQLKGGRGRQLTRPQRPSESLLPEIPKPDAPNEEEAV
jgi:hypothetical protein